MPRNLPVRSIIDLVPPKAETVTKPVMPSAILAAREGGGGMQSPVRTTEVSDEKRRGRPTKEDVARSARMEIDERIRALREEAATRKEVMAYFETRIRELSD